MQAARPAAAYKGGARLALIASNRFTIGPAAMAISAGTIQRPFNVLQIEARVYLRYGGKSSTRAMPRIGGLIGCV